jgi:hypothetical protein
MRKQAFAPPRIGTGSQGYSGSGRRFNIACYGNSLTTGNANPNNYPAALAALRPGDTVTNVGSSNQYTDQMLANFTTDVVPLASTTKTNVCIWWESIDSMNDFGVTPAQELAKLKSAAALCHSNGWLIVVSGALPNADTVGDPATTVPALAALIRADHAWADAWTDMPASPIWNVNDGTYYANPGGALNVHLTDYGYRYGVTPFFNDALNHIVR